MKQSIINFFKFLLFLGFGLTILYFVYQNQEAKYLEDCQIKGIPLEDCSLIDKIIDDFKSANYWWIGVVFLCYIASNISRAIRWKMLIRPLGREAKLSNVFAAVMLGYFGNLGLPRLGEVMRAVAVANYEAMPVEKVVGTVIVERLIDVICLLICIGLCFLIEFDTIYTYVEQWQGGGDGPNYLLFGLGGAGLLVLIVGWFFRKQLLALPLFQKILNIVKGFWEGILAIGKMKNPIAFVGHSIFIWVMYFFMTYFCFFAFEPTTGLPAHVGLLTFVVGALAIAVPSPGGMGTYHIFVIGLLALYGVSEADAFSFANILFFSVQLGINVFIGLLALIALPFMNRDYKPEPIL